MDRVRAAQAAPVGFLEITVADKKLMLALSNILSIAETDNGCELTIAIPVPAFGDSTKFSIDLPYSEIRARMKY